MGVGKEGSEGDVHNFPNCRLFLLSQRKTLSSGISKSEISEKLMIQH